MKKFQINQSSTDGSIYITDSKGKIYLPCDSNGAYIFLDLKSANLLTHFTDGELIYSIQNTVEGLGWIALAIQAGAAIFGSVSSSISQKKANASAEKQLQLQNQGIELQTKMAQMNADLQLKLQEASSSTSSVLPVILISVAGISVVSGIIYFLTKSEKKSKHSKK